MTKSALKLVLSFDTETQTYRPAGHNLSAEQAVEQIDKIQTDGGVAAIVAQQAHHRSLSFHQCKQCKKAAEEFQEEQPQPEADQEESELDASEGGSGNQAGEETSKQ